MHRLALSLALGALVAAGLPSPGLYLALGLGIAAVGCGIAGYGRRGTPGGARLVAATAITVGAVGFVLGAVRVAIVLAAIDRIDRLLG